MTAPRLSIIPARAVYDVSLKPAELRVLAALCCHVDRTGQCWPSIRQIAKRLGHSNHRHLQRHIRTLEDKGYVVITRQYGANGAGATSKFYFPDLHKSQGGGRSVQPPGGGQADQEGDGQTGTKGGGQADHPNVLRERLNRTSHTEDEYFKRFWTAYPNRKPHTNPKKPAREKFLAVLKKGTDPETIIRGAENYAAYIRQEGKDPQYVAQATTFLNKEYWADYQTRPKPIFKAVL